MIELFDSSDDAQKILNVVLRDGVAGIYGTRTAVRHKLGEVRELVEQACHETIYAHSTFDHPDTELAYPFDENRYGREEALREVRAVYDARLL